jgi:hypothetical protein
MLRMPIAARRRQPSFRYSIRGSCWVRRDQCSRLAGFSVRLSRSPEQRRVSIAGLPRAEFRSHIRAGRYCLRADTMIRPVFRAFTGALPLSRPDRNAKLVRDLRQLNHQARVVAVFQSFEGRLADTVGAQLLAIIGDDVHVMPIPAMPERAAKFRCQSAADPVPAPPSSAVGRLGQIGFSGLITKEFLTLSEQFLTAKRNFSLPDSGITSAPAALSRRRAGCDS